MNNRLLHGVARLFRRIVSDQSGQELAETAMVLPLLLFLALGIVEFGSMFSTTYTLTSLGREGANIAARGAPLDTVNALMLENGADIGLSTLGGVITSRVVVIDTIPTVTAQAATGSYAGHSRIGLVNSAATGLLQLATDEGASFVVVEIFYIQDALTPLESILAATIPDTLYSRAVF